MTSEPDIFISYASDTKALAVELTRALQSQGFHTWADFNDLHPGQQWREEIERALDSAHWVVIVVSANSLATPWLETEWSAALSKVWSDSRKRLLPVVIGAGQPPPFLRNWVGLNVDPAAEPAQWTRHVLSALRSAQNQAPPELSAESRLERKNRLIEMSQSAEKLRKLEAEPQEPEARSNG